MTERAKPARWHELVSLAEDCPNVVNHVSITGTTRLLLWLLAHRSKGVTGSSFLKLPTIMQKLGCSKNTRDEAIADLKRSGLLFTQEVFDPGSQTGRAAIRTLDVTLLFKEVVKADAENQAVLALKNIEKQTRQILKRLENNDSVTYGPIPIEEAKNMAGCLERIANFPFSCKARPSGDRTVQVSVSRTDRAPGGRGADEDSVPL